jgi:hypothetical protein
MEFHNVQRNVEPACNRFVSHAFGHRGKHLQLPWCEKRLSVLSRMGLKPESAAPGDRTNNQAVTAQCPAAFAGTGAGRFMMMPSKAKPKNNTVNIRNTSAKLRTVACWRTMPMSCLSAIR